MKKRISLLLVIAMMLSLIAVSLQTEAASKPRLSQKSVTLQKNDYDEFRIEGIKWKQVSDIDFSTSDETIADTNYDGLSFEVFTYDKPGTATIKIVIYLKKKIAGKKKYTLKMKVTVQSQEYEKNIEGLKQFIIDSGKRVTSTDSDGSTTGFPALSIKQDFNGNTRFFFIGVINNSNVEKMVFHMKYKNHKPIEISSKFCFQLTLTSMTLPFQ